MTTKTDCLHMLHASLRLGCARCGRSLHVATCGLPIAPGCTDRLMRPVERMITCDCGARFLLAAHLLAFRLDVLDEVSPAFLAIADNAPLRLVEVPPLAAHPRANMLNLDAKGATLRGQMRDADERIAASAAAIAALRAADDRRARRLCEEHRGDEDCGTPPCDAPARFECDVCGMMLCEACVILDGESFYCREHAAVPERIAVATEPAKIGSDDALGG